MKEIWVCDAETDPFKAGRSKIEPFIWGAYNGDEYHEFLKTDDLIDFFKDKEVIVYAHNGGKFDYHFLLHRLEPYDQLTVINGRLAKFTIGLCEFRDSYNILPCSLATFQKTHIDYAIFEKSERHKPENWLAIRNYLRDDCRDLHEFVSAFINNYGLHLTQASAAMSFWRKLTKNKAPKSNKAFYQEIAPYYFGGRVECFAGGIIEDDFKVIDINSAYPWAMTQLHPYGLTYDISDELPHSPAHIARCFITLECISHGAFPFRADDKSLIFPNDDIKRVYNVTGWEFLAAIDTRTIKNWTIKTVLRFTDSISFGDYVEHFSDLKITSKLAGDKAGYIFAKLFLNSLYGKFGANPENYEEYMPVPHHYVQAAEEDDYFYMSDLGPLALVGKALPEEKQRYLNVAVAASVTGCVRAYLWRSINKCDGVLYCDTDSIACKSSGDLKLHPTELGAWDVEAVCDYAAIAGKKMYAFHKKGASFNDNVENWKIASKGVKLKASELIKVADGQEITFTPISPSFSLKRGNKIISRKITKKVVIAKK